MLSSKYFMHKADITNNARTYDSLYDTYCYKTLFSRKNFFIPIWYLNYLHSISSYIYVVKAFCLPYKVSLMQPDEKSKILSVSLHCKCLNIGVTKRICLQESNSSAKSIPTLGALSFNIEYPLLEAIMLTL